jgi:hypothetical protein
VNLLTAFEQPVDLIEAAPSGVHPDDHALLLLVIDAERLFQVLDQWAEGLGKMQIAGIEAIVDELRASMSISIRMDCLNSTWSVPHS